MSKLHKPLLFLLLLSLTACLPTTDGQYLIYKAETVPTYGLGGNIDYKASDKMIGQFKGKKFNIQFNPKYATVREENSDEDLILNNVSDDTKALEYELTYTKNKEKVKLTLYDKAEDESKDILMFITIQEQLLDSIGQTVDGRYGLIKCHLTKPTN